MFTVMEVRSVSLGHGKDISFPSEDDREHLVHGSEKIFLPAELFEKQGIKSYEQQKALLAIK